MPHLADEKPVLLIKKIGGLALLLLGFLLIVLGYANGSNGLSASGIFLLAGGMALLVLKIHRRNQP